YNEVSGQEMETVRDFIILHYHLNQRDEPLWREMQEMELPEKLARRIAQFRQRGHAWQGEDELFRLDSWTHCMVGQGVMPEQHHPLPRAMSDQELKDTFDHIRKPLVQAAAQMPSHVDFLNSYCKAQPSVWNVRGPSRVSCAGARAWSWVRSRTCASSGAPSATRAHRGRGRGPACVPGCAAPGRG